MEFTPKLIAEYHRNNRMRHGFYKEAVERYEELECHFDGKAPEKLIKERRPGESENVFNYRMKIYQSPTKPILSRVYNSLQKIRKSSDWSVKFNPLLPASIAEAESPEMYINYKLPMYESITNWIFSRLLRSYLIDANGMVALQPYQMMLPEASEYLKPVPVIYDADDVYDYVQGSHALLKSDEKVKMYNSRNSYSSDGCVYYVIDTMKIQRWVQTSTKEQFTLEREYLHNLGYLPVYQTFGIITDTSMEGMLAESRLAPMLPYLNEMAREYSDLQAEVVQHIHSTFWYYAAVDCTACKGSGKLTRAEDNAKIQCSGCGGTGKKKIALNSYEAIALPPPEPGSTTNLPTPPAGFIQKDTDMARLQNERVDAHGYRALSSMNMQFLDSSPLNQSGLAKEVDRDELQNTVHSIAEDLVRIADSVCKTIIDMRYGEVVSNPDQRKELYPVIVVPEKYDLLTSSIQVDALTKLTQAGVDSTIIQAAQLDLAAKMFSADPTVKNRVMMNTELDPLAGKTQEEISMGLMNQTIREIDAIIHDNKKSFIDRAMEENNFMVLSRADKMAILERYAAEIITQRQTPPNAAGTEE